MNHRGYTKPTSLQARIGAWFKENPGESLSYVELQTKFCAGAGAVSMAVSRLVEQGDLERVPIQVRVRR